MACFVLLCGLAPVALALSPRVGEPIAVLRLMPDVPVPAAIAEADVRLLWMSSGGHVVVLSAATPELIGALYRDGAFIVLAAAPMSGCSPEAVATSPLTGNRQP